MIRPPPNTPLPNVKGREWPWCKHKTPRCSDTRPLSFPKITVVTPSYNQGEFLEKTIRSVLLQGYPNLEYIVIDGGSSDNSIEIIKKYEPWINYWESEKDRGQSHAINKGFSKATGELLGWLNSDDYYVEGALARLVKAYEENPSVGVVYGQGHIVNQAGEIIYTPNLVQVDSESLGSWSFGNDFMQPSCLFSRKAWEDCGPLDESLHYSLDVDLWLKIAEQYRFTRVEDVLSISLSHAGAKTTAQRYEMQMDLAVVYMRHGKEASARRILDMMAVQLNKFEQTLQLMHESPRWSLALKNLKAKLGFPGGSG